MDVLWYVHQGCQMLDVNSEYLWWFMIVSHDPNDLLFKLTSIDGSNFAQGNVHWAKPGDIVAFVTNIWNWTLEAFILASITKNIKFRDTCESEYQVSMFKNFISECCNWECTLWLWEKFVQRLVLVEDVWKAWLNMIKGRALYQSVILRLSDLFRERERDSIIIFGVQIWTMRPKLLHFT